MVRNVVKTILRELVWTMGQHMLCLFAQIGLLSQELEKHGECKVGIAK